ncbi:hypothetical protein TSAR_014684 [Trichomalopsis sarcophagae]|uniref:Uncharacterized protein n=1 Tax=Trichomalopsis sarcophagae TaxID=543379 RepID=A0A232F5L8_9HYME|nr:hypothetical protein TSAR_014684 [Trichomalopsis sarcophagae]
MPLGAKPTAQMRKATAEEVGASGGQQQNEGSDQNENPRAHCIYCNQHGHSDDACVALVRHASKRAISNPYQKKNNIIKMPVQTIIILLLFERWVEHTNANAGSNNYKNANNAKGKNKDDNDNNNSNGNCNKSNQKNNKI